MTNTAPVTERRTSSGNVASAGGDRHAVTAPIVVLTYAHAGAELLTEVLSASSSLACTSGTGLLPLCHSAAATWQVVENRGAAPSALAIQSVRALASLMNTIVLAQAGASRWCEVAFAKPAAAETFMHLFPEVRFLCLHRSLQGVITEALEAYPWGLGGSPFWPHASKHPGNSVATAAAYWVASTQPLLEFEEMYPQSCLRVRWEDLAAGLATEAAEVFAFLGLDTRDLAGLRHREGSRRPGEAGDRDRAPVPVGKIPRPLLARVIELQTSLGYAAPA
jgi:hypothetical protein